MADSKRNKRKGGGGIAAKQGVMRSHPGTGQFQRTGQLTDMQKLFCRYYARNGGQAKAAAIQAGYSPAGAQQAAAENLRNPAVLDELRRERDRYIAGDLGSLAADTLRELLTDGDVSANVRFQAARWCLEAAGHGGKSNENKDIDPDKSLSEMTIEELEAFIAGGRAAVEQEKRTVDVTPEPDGADSPGSAPDSAPDDNGGGLMD